MQRTAVINVVGLTDALIGDQTPRIREFASRGVKNSIEPAFPGVTCTAQSTYLTGATPHAHGIVGNGWYDRNLAEVQFWKQSNHLVHGPKLWDELRERDSTFTCAKLFWWFNMYSSVDYSITPRPMYPADGRKVFDIYSWPYSIRPEIKHALGEFPFPAFWGPAAGIDSSHASADAVSRWIAGAAKWIELKYQPTLNLIYLPHLDYNLQRHGPYANAAATGDAHSSQQQASAPRLNPAIHHDLREIDSIVGGLIDFFRNRMIKVMLLSEYGITNVSRPVHLNRLFREKGWLVVKDELGLELLDPGASKVFAVADHQIAHVYLNDRSLESTARAAIESMPGVARVLDSRAQAELGIDHPRAGDLIAVADQSAWFTYYYWLDDNRAPDFARTVDIHRKPGYDPVELFTDPTLSPLELKIKVATRLLKKKMGMRMLMDVVPLDANLVKGSHGCRPSSTADFPVLIGERDSFSPGPPMHATDVYHALKRCVLG